MVIKVLLAALLLGALVLAVVRAVSRPHAAGGPVERPAAEPGGGPVERPAARGAASRLDALAMWAAVFVPSSVVFGWQVLGWHGAGAALLAPLGVIALWFVYRVAVPSGFPDRPAGSGRVPARASAGGSGRGSALYHLVLTAVAAWAAVSLASALGSRPASQQLGSLIQHVIVWIVLLLASAGWLLSAFATPGKPSERPSRVLGTLEALFAAALAACFFTLS
ncbi:hypothetical protein [Arthrobacter sp.]|uniref:hypothetical protein n=1 Tax=Arthrobacter sp. TaxID=1667 RepID=UPI00258383C7|nr:hypothetical protein [Arthrobacter sp.]